MATGSRRPAWRSRVLAIGLGVLATPVVVELGLQVAALFVSVTRSSRVGAEGSALVVCQGDSNVFGLHLDAHLAWPAQLEALLAERGVDRHVANRGVPGKSTWIVRDELQSDLERFQPRALVVLAGINDRNTLRPEDGVMRALSRVRTVNLVKRLIARASEGGVDTWKAAEEELPNLLTKRSIEVIDHSNEIIHFEDRSNTQASFARRAGKTEPEVFRAWIAEDLTLVAERAREADVVPLFVAYPLERGPFVDVNAGIEEAVRRSGAHLVDPRPWFERALEELPEPELVFADGHPTALGYGIVARCVLAALVEEGVVDVEVPDPMEPVHAWQAPELAVEPVLEDDRVCAVQVRYRSGHRVQLMLSTSRGRTPTRWRGVMHPVEEGGGRHEVPLARDAVFDAAWRDAGRYLVPFDAEGMARIELDAGLVDRQGGSLWCTVVVVAPGSRVVTISDAIRLR